jgi:recombinational DNA repair ATPase RecF
VIQLIKKCQVIVVLDDVFSELDRYHQELLLTEVMSQGQVFISTTEENTDRERFGKKTVTIIQVCEGRLDEKSYNG